MIINTKMIKINKTLSKKRFLLSVKCEGNSTFFILSRDWANVIWLKVKNNCFSLSLSFHRSEKRWFIKSFLHNLYFDPFFLWMKSEINKLLLEISFFKKLPHYQVIQRNKTRPSENHIFTTVLLFLTHRLLHIG